MRPVILALLILLPALASAATAEDLDGHWVVDAEATWAMMQEQPQMRAQFGAMPSDQQAMIRAMVLAKMAKASWSLGGGKATIIEPDGTKRQSAWSVSRTKGDVLSVEAVDEAGTTRSGTLTLDGERLIARGFADPKAKGKSENVLVLRRGAAPAGDR